MIPSGYTDLVMLSSAGGCCNIRNTRSLFTFLNFERMVTAWDWTFR